LCHEIRFFGAPRLDRRDIIILESFAKEYPDMRIAIVDDLAEERALLKERLSRLLGLRGAEAELLEFESGESFLSAEKKRRLS